MRINKFLSRAGYCSRREADRLVEQGRVTINGKTPELGTKVKSDDKVKVDGKVIENKKEEPTYLAFNKPVGIVCTTDSSVEKDNIIDYINYPKRIYPIGRLDKPSEGLILLTDDGAIVNKILRSRNDQGKEYVVTVDRPVTADFIKGMSEGVPILDTVTKKCKVWKTGNFEFHIVLTQGLNRQIRRMCDYFDYKITKLKRIRVINIHLDDLPIGEYRELTDQELKELKRVVE
ncbi:MAG TPA: 23S rRNA pseudouridine(2604) synthase RluF [Flavobacteriaceae bacterium]|nr:23S rRNA pseudouridine(2604) synthase RluF [Flavobacteriaceae bacterium]